MNNRLLKSDEIDVKIGSVTSKGYTLLLYKNARVDMAILDEIYGQNNWQRDHKEVKGNLYCGIGIWDKEKSQWIWKWDCGVESAFGDKEKGEASDAFKRAGFNWNIGRELYTAPRIFVSCETYLDGKVYKIADDSEKYRKFRVSEISYNDNGEIENLVIVDQNDEVAYPSSLRITTKATIKSKSVELPNNSEFTFANGKYKGKTVAEVYSVDKKYLELCLQSNIPQAIKDEINKVIGGK